MNHYLQQACHWFSTVKAPELKEKVDIGIAAIEAGQPLEESYKKLFGFLLFSHTMRNGGPAFFHLASRTAEEIGVLDDMLDYARSWIAHSKTKWGQDELSANNINEKDHDHL